MVYLAIIGVLIIGERYMKEHIERNRELGKEEAIFNGNVIIEKYHNKGVALNFLEKYVSLVKVVTGTMIGLLLVVLGMLLKNKRNTLAKVGLALILGGAISNWIDRMEKGYVVDYFRINKGKKLKNIVFNIADICVFLGGLFVVIGELFSTEK